MKKIVSENRMFLWPFIFVWLLVGVVLIVFQKTEIHLFINKFHIPFFDYFFTYVTHIGDGLTPTILAILLLFFSFRKAFIVGVGAAFTGVIAQFFKRVVFSDALRPKELMSDFELYFVPNVDVHGHLSFPSGHTATAFCLFFTLAVFSRNMKVKVLCFIAAVIVGYSRMYLSQHFLIDVYFGAIVGLVAALLSLIIFKNINAKWVNLSLIRIFRKESY